MDTGKSTICGHLLYLMNIIDPRLIDKYEKEIESKNRKTKIWSWITDIDETERDSGKTFDVGKKYFETNHKKITILDAPGHQNLVPIMISGLSQADYAILVISAKKNEFLSSLEHGQTIENLVIAKAYGIKKIIILVNKMDCINWDEDEYKNIEKKIEKILIKKIYFEKNNFIIIPCSGILGTNLKKNENIIEWYKGPSLLEYLDNLSIVNRNEDLIRIIITTYEIIDNKINKLICKIENGNIYKNQELTLMPLYKKIQILNIYIDDDIDIEINNGIKGQFVKIKLNFDIAKDIKSFNGYIFCNNDNLCNVNNKFKAQVVILDCFKSIITPGFKSIMHIHTLQIETNVLNVYDINNKKKIYVKKNDKCIIDFETEQNFCFELYDIFPKFGRFIMRYQNQTIIIGKIIKNII